LNCATARSNRLALATALALALSSFGVRAAESGGTVLTLDALLDPVRSAAAVNDQKVSAFRQDALREAALSLGSRGGLAAQGRIIRDDLESRAVRLDALYQFSTLLTPQGVMPPVIVEARDAMTVQPDVMKIADRIYRIEAKARFVSAPPTWRDYLFLGLPGDSKAAFPHPSLLPKSPEEQSLWRQWVIEGWNDGVSQANAIHELNLARLDRDYQGMLRYSLLLAKGLVAEPTVGSDTAVVTGNANEMIVGSTVHRVTAPAKLVTDPAQWRPIVTVIDPATGKKIP
jgi:defect-in-organelle-trafficking protein DotC